jgi:hypothetical protein
MTVRGQSHNPHCAHHLDHGLLEYWAGAGIVADSNPAAEEQETLDKTAVLRMIADASARLQPALHATSRRG